MIASFHIIQYRKMVVFPPTPKTADTPGLRFWRPLNIGGDFAWFREHPSRWSLYPRLRPDFHRWAFYGVWDDDATLDRFMADSKTAVLWEQAAVEACHLRLRPSHIRGPWNGMQVLSGSETPHPAGAPLACLARADLSPRGVLAFWGSAAPDLLRHLPNDDRLLLGIPLVDRPYAQPVSFSIWRTSADATDFVRHGDDHRAAVRRVQRSQPDFTARFSSGRFEPYRCEGSWAGRELPAIAQGTVLPVT